MQTIIKGEKRYIPMKVTRKKFPNVPFTIEDASYEVLNVVSGDCMIDQENKDIYFLLDTSSDDFKAGRKYLAEFTATIEGLPKVLKGRVVINIV